MANDTRKSVSVVIPCYNRGKTILSCLNSVLSQEYSPLEVIIVDDGSNDDSVKQVETLNNPNVKIIKQRNMGGSVARNTGIRSAMGDYIAFLDSDDVFLPFHLAQAMSIVNSGVSDFVYSQVIVRRGESISFIKPPRSISSDEDISEYLLSNRGFVQTSTIVVKRELALATLFDDKLRYGQDTDFAIRLVSCGARIIMAPRPSVIWADEWDDKRISSKINYINRIEWLDRVRPFITKKAYYADMGWPIAKGFRQDGHAIKALSLFFSALLRRCYGAKLSITIFFQILLGNTHYRKFADFLVKLGFKP